MAKVDPALSKALGLKASETEFLSALNSAAQQQLITDIASARKAHSQHIREALEEALNHIPRLIRGPIKKLFGA